MDNFDFLNGMINEFQIDIKSSRQYSQMETPVEEQIIVMHRIDHSIHIARLWIIQETRVIAYSWKLENFFLITKHDAASCLMSLTKLKVS